MSVDWVLVADSSRARILHLWQWEPPVLVTLTTLVHPESRESRQERESAEPGRLQMPGGARTAVEPHTDPQQLLEGRFAAEVADHLERARQEHRFDRLIVFAPPHFLGVLRKAWSPLLQQRIIREVDKDFASLTESQLTERLTPHIAGLNA